MKYILIASFFILLTGCSTSNYYLVRHAEKMDDSKDPPLSDLGIVRANALKDSLLEKGIDLLYATDYQRTQQTLQPLANALNKGVVTYDASKTQEFVENIKRLNDKNVVVAGHSNTVPEMVLYLTGNTVHIGHDDYFNLFLVEKKKSIFKVKYKLIEKRYGE